MEVFLSYHRESAGWPARLIKERLERQGADVFMDVENINSGRFETVILNEIGRRDHFIVLLTPETCERLGSKGNWVRKELERALELRKNVVPVLLDGATIERVPSAFPRREQLLGINACTLPFELFSESIDTLYERFLSKPTIEELESKTAEEYFRAGQEAQEREAWVEAEREFEHAVRLRRRPEYLLGLAVARHQQGRNLEALNDLDAAISANPFAFEIMQAKFNLLQHLNRMQEAIDLPEQWRKQAQQRASAFAERILRKVSDGSDLLESVRSIPELTFLYGHMPALGEVGASIGCLLEHVSGNLRRDLRETWESWRSSNEPALRKDWESWKNEV
jgi:tetratricopeptide (TPR) repeat protein